MHDDQDEGLMGPDHDGFPGHRCAVVAEYGVGGMYFPSGELEEYMAEEEEEEDE